ncbi:MAG TPA: hypothetical protein PK289_05990 [Bacteroidia bacterium]|jgi:hypothetical protein|nr:hypothetical protein [Bacteroidia bacterium]HRG53855.1 hypothetical protein [Bacteroidia bacterium]
MNKKDYNLEAQQLVRIIDIAVDCFTKMPPEGFEEATIKHLINTYLGWKDDALNPEPKFKNLKSLSYVKKNVMTYFQEGEGDEVELFWKEIQANKIDIKRTSVIKKIKKILKRGKIKNDLEYDDVIDLYNSYIESLTEEEGNKLNDLISDFEKKK